MAEEHVALGRGCSGACEFLLILLGGSLLNLLGAAGLCRSIVREKVQDDDSDHGRKREDRRTDDLEHRMRLGGEGCRGHHEKHLEGQPTRAHCHADLGRSYGAAVARCRELRLLPCVGIYGFLRIGEHDEDADDAEHAEEQPTRVGCQVRGERVQILDGLGPKGVTHDERLQHVAEEDGAPVILGLADGLTPLWRLTAISPRQHALLRAIEGIADKSCDYAGDHDHKEAAGCCAPKLSHLPVPLREVFEEIDAGEGDDVSDQNLGGIQPLRWQVEAAAHVAEHVR
mmetsp:Transcript_152839/g.490267  ORF Transcript_152839/g.490267 Transcript_152839/m.490267 type:complete len:285 (+) Transcript_152839:753-1607(+)